MKWTESEINQLSELFYKMYSYDDIANILNRSYGSVKGQLEKLDLRLNRLKNITKICLQCESEFNTVLSSRKKFCSSSCSATYNNLKRCGDNTCLTCGVKISKSKKFCSNSCQGEFKIQETYNLIENGDTTLSDKSYKNYLINKFGNKCMDCGWCETHTITGKVPIQLEHIDGNSDNNSLDNLKLLCPNCHSLTPTFGALNKGNGRELRRIKRQGKGLKE